MLTAYASSYLAASSASVSSSLPSKTTDFYNVPDTSAEDSYFIVIAHYYTTKKGLATLTNLALSSNK